MIFERIERKQREKSYEIYSFANHPPTQYLMSIYVSSLTTKRLLMNGKSFCFEASLIIIDWILFIVAA
jgi:hypothetical protein